MTLRVLQDYDQVHSWQLGAELNLGWFGDHPDVFAPWHTVEAVILYPSVFDGRGVGVEGSQTELGTTSLLAHFVAYVNGANNITRGFPQSPTPSKSDDRFSADVGTGTQTEGPCDILAAAGNPCVAAHSTTRALFANYSGPLYNLSRPDGTSKSIGVTEPGGFADKAAHDAFCGSMDCVVFNIFDQSPKRNHLGPRHKLVNASRHPIMAGGKEVYGLWFDAVSSP